MTTHPTASLIKETSRMLSNYYSVEEGSRKTQKEKVLEVTSPHCIYRD